MCHASLFKPLRQPLEAHLTKGSLCQLCLLWFRDFQIEPHRCILSLHGSLCLFVLSHSVTYKQTKMSKVSEPLCLLVPS